MQKAGIHAGYAGRSVQQGGCLQQIHFSAHGYIGGGTRQFFRPRLFRLIAPRQPNRAAVKAVQHLRQFPPVFRPPQFAVAAGGVKGDIIRFLRDCQAGVFRHGCAEQHFRRHLIGKGLGEQQAVAQHGILSFFHGKRLCIEKRGQTFPRAFSVQTHHRRTGHFRRQRAFYQPLAVQNTIEFFLPQCGFQTAYCLPGFLCKQFFAPLPPVQGMDFFRKRMKAGDVGKTFFAQPVQFYIGTHTGQIADGGQRVYQIAHARQTHQ